MGSRGAGEEAFDIDAVAEPADDGVGVEVVDEEVPEVNKNDTEAVAGTVLKDFTPSSGLTIGAIIDAEVSSIDANLVN